MLPPEKLADKFIVERLEPVKLVFFTVVPHPIFTVQSSLLLKLRLLVILVLVPPTFKVYAPALKKIEPTFVFPVVIFTTLCAAPVASNLAVSKIPGGAPETTPPTVQLFAF